MRDSVTAEWARQMIYARDLAAYERLSPRQQKIAARLGAWGFQARRWTGMAGHNTVRKIERGLGVVLEKALWLADKILFAPYRYVINKAEQAGQAVVNGLKAVVKGGVKAGGYVLDKIDSLLGFSQRFIKNGKVPGAIGYMRNKLRSGRRQMRYGGLVARRAINRGWRRTKEGTRQAIKAAAYGCDWAASRLIYTPFVWLFDPRLPRNKPLFAHEGLNKTFGFVLAGATLVATAQLLAVLKVYAVGWHATVNTAFWNPEASYLTNMLMIGAGHAAISGSLTVGKMILLPLLAAARTGIKNNNLTAGIAAQYTRRLHLAKRRDMAHEASLTEKPKQPLKMVEVFFVDMFVKGTHPCQFEPVRAEFAMAAHGAPAIAAPTTTPSAKAQQNSPQGPRATPY